MSDRFTENAKKIINVAQQEAKRLGHAYIGSEHILLGILMVEDSLAMRILAKMGADSRRIKSKLGEVLKPGDNMMLLGDIEFTTKSKKVLEHAFEEAQKMGQSFIGTEHILLGILKEEDGIASKILQSMGIKHDAVAEEILAANSGNFDKDDSKDEERESPHPRASAKTVKTKTPTLDEFARDMTQHAKDGLLDPVIGRENEIDRLVQVLGRRTKNNPVLIGEPGVGKTAIVEGLAQKIVSGDISDTLAGKRLLSLDLASIVAGTKYRGEFEQRLKSIIEEIRKAKNSVIVFIDELHTVIGAGAAEGAIDASNMLKPALARGELQCIGATTFDEYRKHIEHDPALERRFQPIIVDPPNLDETIEILKGLKEKYENHHKCKYTENAIITAASLSDKYITDRALPDKAIDLLDEAGSRARLKLSVYPVEFKAKEKELEELGKKEKELMEGQESAKLSKLKEKKKELKKEIDEMKKKWREEREKKWPVVTEEDIAIVASKWTGIPVTRLNQSETEKLIHMEEELHKRLIGQDEAVRIISQAIKRSRTGMKDPKKPIGNFIFLGPTGVGKTELARTLAEFLFGNEDSMVRIDMSEYMEKFSVSRLIGAPPGYVGYEEGGKLTELVRRKPYSVVVLDEIEKAHPDVFNILLQVMDEGNLTDSLGHKVSFKNTILIMTSNVGARLITKGKSLGFIPQEDKERDYREMKDTVMDEVKRVFNPEFINRVDEIIVFRPLTEEDMRKILEIHLGKVASKLKERGLKTEITERAKELLVKKGFDPNYGARPIIRTVQKMVEDPMSEFILVNMAKENDTIFVDADEKDEGLSMKIK
ncbi:MAG: ATP-dependent Clp protease ATP-binding subunit [Elusimicrobia bacterium]|nr:ATP-dependent Clp protease ATP-binding subunit [Elusimicrobiota bacterium]